MVDVRIYKKDELYIGIEAEPFLFYELRDVFAFRPDGYKFSPKFKHGIWDGYIRLLDIRDQKLPIGLIGDFIRYLTNNGYTYEIDKTYGNLVTKFDITEFLSNQEKWSRIKLYDYQEQTVKTIFGINKGLVLSPTGSGKSLIIFAVLRYLLEHTSMSILLTVPTTQLVEQMFSDFKSYEVESDEIKVSENCHRLYGGKDRYIKQNRILISTWQSIYKNDRPFFLNFSGYICDEAHLADASSLTGIIGKLSSTSKIRVGLTGTLDGTKCHAMQLKALFGPTIKTQTTRELMDRGVLSDIKIECHVCEYTDPDFLKTVRKMDYHNEVMSIVTNDSRTDYILDTALKLNNNTLILFNYVDKHGKVMYNKMLELAKKHGKQVYFIYGGIKVDEREKIRNAFANNTNVILFASYGTFSAGINIKNIHYLMLAHPQKGQIRVLQSIGRSLRLADDKTFATIIDIVDDVCPNLKKNNKVYDHFLKRLEIYEAQEFDYTIKKIKLKENTHV